MDTGDGQYHDNEICILLDIRERLTEFLNATKDMAFQLISKWKNVDLYLPSPDEMEDTGRAADSSNGKCDEDEEKKLHEEIAKVNHRNLELQRELEALVGALQIQFVHFWHNLLDS